MGKIIRISGPVVVAEDVEDAKMYDVVKVGEMGLIGEIIKIEGNRSTIQVYEDTAGIRPDEKVENTRRPLSVELGPGILKSIYDGIQRPLDVIKITSGDFIARGLNPPALDRQKKWEFVPAVKKGETVFPGQILGTVQETSLITHRIMVPEGISGKVTMIADGEHRVEDVIATVSGNGKSYDIQMMTTWPVRKARRVQRKLPPEIPLVTGQRVIDALFPVAKGGTAAVPGPFGSGKCVSGDTPVLLDAGERRIGDLFMEAIQDQKNAVEIGQNEEIVRLHDPLRIYSMVGSEIVESVSHAIYHGKSNAIVTVRTENGREVRVTPVHKLFVKIGNSVIERPASEVNEGDEIACASVSENGDSQTVTTTLVLTFDRVVSKEMHSGVFDVYDLMVPDYGYNFIGGNGLIVLHNTVIQHQLAKWSDANIVVYIGCGERGNEMTEILTTFPELKDPNTGQPLMDRTVLIANTSNMPVAAREASIYTGITIAEYYRDMGYDVALMADSTSRWAEALREISGRLEEMPGEEGYPAYLGRRVSEFYERSGRARLVSPDERYGSITVIGAVSPPGGDISEPVSQNTLRVTRVFWALDAALANRRHFPSINWLNSYSLYTEDLRSWYDKNVSSEWSALRERAMEILQRESELQEVAQLVGYDAMPEKEKSILDVARIIREDFLQQSAFDEIDAYCSLKKQYLMLKAIMEIDTYQNKALDSGATMDNLASLAVREKLSRMKIVPEAQVESYYNDLVEEIHKEYGNFIGEKNAEASL
ncbi:probable ATP synthase, subunit A (intein containing) [Thermoplasma acidophilum]|uniref:A-type ATP synthase subunit A n=1 Tax=Thermoplasma acidophilum (strain ATCC 25905 / DSM 1728 / JCM 9062 / NBRC 15155 / AMRC-C165) TaxID=273075 RepID=AATA_THEAC|nr:V-type ATP synthase subunit A [Thermoplasma acidophilum]Q9P997.2 RecName: Full=V-type ATP synthase alpha chain; AltName: Full=V-ATPase subunit A; Contains: RecName: Full=Tac AtpA intein; AltName: Full=Tac VMA intein [Thermoplasma acidophilum DSM 1728]CAC11153.1 probable ATP synthase, subunit A (intein containing) [Thermoplasma acidophilum]